MSTDWSQALERVPPIDVALVGAAAVAGLTAVLFRRRGGRFRELPGWAGFWGAFSLVLIALSRLPSWVGFPMLATVMFAALRTYFFVAPVRTRDRYAILATYLAIPFSLWPAYLGSRDMFLATVPVTLFLLVPVFLSAGSAEEGLLDSMGRTLLGVLFFVFCLAHLGLLVHQEPRGVLELFGVLVLAAELPQRIAGRFGSGAAGWARPVLGLVLSVLLTVGLAWWLGPWCGLDDDDAARAGLLVAVAVALGALISGAVSRDLALTTSSRIGRGGLLNRMVPAVYAAPVYFHYLDYFAP